jgi:hypothetical protein
MVFFIYARNIIIAGGDGADGVVHDFDEFKEKVIKNLHQIIRYNWTGYGVIFLISQMSNKKVIITPGFMSETVDRRGQSGWGNSVQVKIALEDVSGRNGSGPGFAGDEILLHELVHAYFFMRGRVRSSFLYIDQGFNYHHNYEFDAILLTNIYMSAKGRSPLRKDHTQGALEAKYSDDRNFLLLQESTNGFTNEYPHQKLIYDLILESHDLLYGYVRHDTGRFNPVRYFLNNNLFYKQQEEIREKRKPNESILLEDGTRMETL